MESLSHKKSLLIALGLVVLIVLIIVITPDGNRTTPSASMNVEEVGVEALQDLLPEALPMEEGAEVLQSHAAVDEVNGSRIGMLSYETQKELEVVYEEYTTYMARIQDTGTTIRSDISSEEMTPRIATASAQVNNGVLQATFSETPEGTLVEIGYAYTDPGEDVVADEL